MGKVGGEWGGYMGVVCGGGVVVVCGLVFGWVTNEVTSAVVLEIQGNFSERHGVVTGTWWFGAWAGGDEQVSSRCKSAGC
uniref:Uncharacterized protein n=1 Tax=Knipowitschia caucasica TaxID=637954 RepID=A0AAV2JLG2_KNICA